MPKTLLTLVFKKNHEKKAKHFEAYISLSEKKRFDVPQLFRVFDKLEKYSYGVMMRMNNNVKDC